MKPHRHRGLFVLFGLFSVLFWGMWVAQPAKAAGVEQQPGTPTPEPSTTPTPKPPDPIRSVQEIFYKISFPFETLTDALNNVLEKAVEKQNEEISKEIKRLDWNRAVADAYTSIPGNGYFARAAQNTVPIAGLLAATLFLLRLAIYHWNKLVGEDDSPTTVLADWIVAAVMAISVGPILDLVAQLISWIMLQGIQSTVDLSNILSSVLALPSFDTLIKGMLGAILQFILGIVFLVAASGLLLAPFVTAMAMFVLSYLGPPVAILGVIPQFRWMRSLWVKALGVVIICPFMAIAVLKGMMELSTHLVGDNLIYVIARALMLLASSGMLLSVVGILGQVTISTSVDAIKQMTGAVQGIVTLAAAAATGGVALAGAGSAAAVAAGAGGASAAGGAAATGGGGGGVASSLAHLQQASSLHAKASVLDAIGSVIPGARAPAQYMRSRAGQHELASRQQTIQDTNARHEASQASLEAHQARQEEHWNRQEAQWSRSEAGQGEQRNRPPDSQAHSGGEAQRQSAPSPSTGTGQYDPQVSQTARRLGMGADTLGGLLQQWPATRSLGEFERGYQELREVSAKGGYNFDAMLTPPYQQEIPGVVSAYLDRTGEISAASNPLKEAARLGGANTFMRDQGWDA